MNWMLAVGCNGPAEGQVGNASPDKNTALNGDMLAALSSVVGVSRLAISRLPQETNTEPAAKLSALLVQNCSNI